MFKHLVTINLLVCPWLFPLEPSPNWPMHLLISSSTCTSTDALVHLPSTFFWQWHLCNHNVEDLTLCWSSTCIGRSFNTISLPILFEVSLLDVSNKYYLQTFPHQRLIDSWMLTLLREKIRFLSHAYLWPLWRCEFFTWDLPLSLWMFVCLNEYQLVSRVSA